MPICKKCGKSFSNRFKINEIYKNARRRKNCFECSPYKKRNKIYYSDKIECICKKCGRKYIYDKQKGNTKSVCNSCSTYNSKQMKRKMIIFYKGGKCGICGYDKCPEALDFHHVNSDEKQFDISCGNGCSWERLKKEIDKCILVCCRCHREIHYDYYPDAFLKEIRDNQIQINGTHPIFIETKNKFEENINKNKKQIVEMKCECGNIFIQKYRKQKYCCLECSTKYRRKVTWPTKEELSELLKNSTLVSISKKYGVSDNAVKKWAKSYNLL